MLEEVKRQTIGPYYGIQCDEVNDSSNWEQSGLTLRYIKKKKEKKKRKLWRDCSSSFPVTALLTGEALCQNIIRSSSDAGLDICNAVRKLWMEQVLWQDTGLDMLQ